MDNATKDRLTLWIINFLTNRSQRVLVHNTFSDILFTSICSPQGCVLSPLLFILHNDDCRSTQPNFHMVKFADDNVLLFLLFQDAAEQKAAVQFWRSVFISEPSRHTEEDPLLLSC